VPFVSYAAYKDARDSAWQRNPFSKASLTTVAGRLYSSWRTAGDPAQGGLPGATAIAYTSATAGALQDLNGNQMRDSTGVARIVKLAVQFATTPGAGMVQVCDRISGISSLSGLTTGVITTNTVAPSRYAAGAESRGILAAVEIYTALGATAGTVNLNSYTDSEGTTAQAGPAGGVVIGGTGFTEVGRLILLPLAANTTTARGVRSVESINRVTAMASAGDYGVTVFKPLVTIPVHSLGPANTEEEGEGMGYIFPKVVAGACLFFTIMTTATSTGIMHGEVTQGEE
jgi:hypothetical protein